MIDDATIAVLVEARVRGLVRLGDAPHDAARCPDGGPGSEENPASHDHTTSARTEGADRFAEADADPRSRRGTAADGPDPTRLEFGAPEATVLAAAAADLLAPGPRGGLRLSPEGRFVLHAALARELDDERRAALEAVTAEFETLDPTLLAGCTDWQLRGGADGLTPNDHGDEAHDRAVLRRLDDLHAAVTPILERTVAIVARLDRYASGLGTALAAVHAGEHHYLTSPRVASYHSCWHELHEALLIHLGIDRDDRADRADRADRTRGA